MTAQGTVVDPALHRGGPDSATIGAALTAVAEPKGASGWEPILDAFTGVSVVVVGDAMLDCYLEGSRGRTAREAPVPVVDITLRHDVAGGAANTAANLRALGADVSLVSVVGDDLVGTRLRRALGECDLSAGHLIVEEGRATLAKQRIVADDELVLRFDEGSSRPVDPLTEQALADTLRGLVPHADVVVVSDYAYGVLTGPVVTALERSLRSHQTCVVDSRRTETFATLRPTIARMDYREATRLLACDLEGSQTDRAGLIGAHGERLLRLVGARTATVTLDVDGAIVLRHGETPQRVPARPTMVDRAAGAGDTFTAALALGVAAGAGPVDAAHLASIAAAVVVARPGTSRCSAIELRQALRNDPIAGQDGDQRRGSNPARAAGA